MNLLLSPVARFLRDLARGGGRCRGSSCGRDDWDRDHGNRWATPGCHGALVMGDVDEWDTPALAPRQVGQLVDLGLEPGLVHGLGGGFLLAQEVGGGDAVPLELGHRYFVRARSLLQVRIHQVVDNGARRVRIDLLVRLILPVHDRNVRWMVRVRGVRGRKSPIQMVRGGVSE